MSVATNISFTCSVSWTAELGDLENHKLIATASFDTRLNDRLIWWMEVEYDFENTPAPGREHHDTLLTGSIAMKF